jgi:hypothetical protein
MFEEGGIIRKVVALIIIIAVIAGVVILVKNKLTAQKVVDPTKFQAVFLTNGQTYFGKVTNEKSDYVDLSSVYYLVLKQPLQSQSTDLNQTTSQPEYNLVKLGKELHGPTGMSISRSQILFIENLSNDSKVVSAINNQK